MAFHNVRLPEDLSYGSVFGFGFATIVQQTASGHEYRLQRQSQARHRYAPTKAIQTREQAIELKEFAIGRRGALHSWRLKDTLDFTSNADGHTAPTNLDQRIGTGDGAETRFRLLKVYDESGPEPYTRTIRLPVAGTTVVAVAGVTATFSGPDATGWVTLSAAPGLGVAVTAGFEFDVPVRFAADVDAWAKLRADAYESWSADSLEAIEVLDEVEWPEVFFPGGSKAHVVTGSLTIAAADGKVHSVKHTVGGGISLYLPSPDYFPGGDIFVIHNDATSSGTIQIRNDAGTAVGSALSANSTKRVALVISGTTATWLVY